MGDRLAQLAVLHRLAVEVEQELVLVAGIGEAAGVDDEAGIRS